MNELRAGLPPLPPKMARLPIDKRGFPVPYFVALINGEPDHRIADPRAMKACVEQNRCWLCGGPLGRFKAFVIGPMCAVARTVAEPPSHLECATYAAMACPFLSRPNMRRREANIPEARHEAAGTPIMRNPGAVGVWVTTQHSVFRSQQGNKGLLFDIGEPHALYWYAEGRPATRDEVEHSITTGLPILYEEAKKDGDDGLLDLARRVGVLKSMLAVGLPHDAPAQNEREMRIPATSDSLADAGG